MDWPRYFAAVLRYRWLVAALTAIGTFAGILASSLIPTEYQARATVAVDTAGEAALVSGPIRASALLEPEAWVSGLASYGIIQGILVDSAVTGPGLSAEELASNFEADVDAGDSVVRLTLADEDPERVAAVLNEATSRFIDLALELKIENQRELAEDLARRRAYATEALRQTEAVLVESRRVIQASPAELAARRTLRLEAAQDTAVASFYNRRVELEQVTRDRETLDALLEASRDSGLEVAPVQVIAWARGSSELTAALEDMFAKQAELRALRNHYTDEHPRVQQLVDELAVLERPEVPRLTWVLFRMLRARESEMFEQLAAAAAELRATPRRVIEEARLERQVQVFEDFSAELQRRYVEAMSAADSSSSALSVVELAVVPRWPVSRTRKINLILLAFVGCLAIGAAGAVVLDRLDPLLHDPAQVARELGVGVLGTVPRLELRNRELRGMAVEQVVEAFSIIRPNLCAAYAKHGSILVAVSSFAPRDGKTLVVCNLALAFAHMGRQTVVVDAAGRRSTLHKRLDCKHGPGLTEYLAGEASWEEVIQLTKFDSVDLIARGARSPAGLKPLPASSMSGLLGLLRTIYDVVLVEGLPLSYGRDALALGRLAGDVLLVLRADATDLGMLEARLELIEPMPIRLVGAVLNRARGADHS
jgi:capsular exopolysaccharide synthesis family protein